MHLWQIAHETAVTAYIIKHGNSRQVYYHFLTRLLSPLKKGREKLSKKFRDRVAKTQFPYSWNGACVCETYKFTTKQHDKQASNVGLTQTS